MLLSCGKALMYTSLRVIMDELEGLFMVAGRTIAGMIYVRHCFSCIKHADRLVNADYITIEDYLSQSCLELP